MTSVDQLRKKYNIDRILKGINHASIRDEILANPIKYIHRMTKLVGSYDATLCQMLKNNLEQFVTNPLTVEQFVKMAEWCHIDSLLRQASKGQFSYELICPHSARLHVLLCAMIAVKGSETQHVKPKDRIPNYIPHYQELETLIFKIPLSPGEEFRLLRLLCDLDPVRLVFLQRFQATHKQYTDNQKSALFWAEEKYHAQDAKVSQYFAAFLYGNTETVTKAALSNIVDLFVIDSLSSAVLKTNSDRKAVQQDILDWTLKEYYKRNTLVIGLVREISVETIREDDAADIYPMLLTLECLYEQSTNK